jgi:DNA repair exonuclease SbcCD ATPase subunit
MRINLFSRLMVFLPYRQCEATLSGAHEEIDRLTNKLQHVDTTTTCRYIQTELPIELLESLNHEIKLLASQNVSLASHNEALSSKLEDLSHQFAKEKQEFSEQSQKFAVSTAAQIQRLEKEVESMAYDLSRLDVLREHEEKIAGLKNELQRVNMMNTSEKKMWRSILDERTTQLQKSFTTYENDKEKLTQEVIMIQCLVIIELSEWIYTPSLSCVMGWLTL